MGIKVLFQNGGGEDRTVFASSDEIHVVVQAWNDDMLAIDTDFDSTATAELICSTDKRQFWFNLEFVDGVATRLIAGDTIPVGNYHTPTHFQGSTIEPAMLIVAL